MSELPVSGIDAENARTIQQFTEKQRLYATRRTLPDRPAGTGDKAAFSAESEYLFGESAKTEAAIIARIQALQPAPNPDVAPVPSFDPTLSGPETRARLARAQAAYDDALLAVGVAEANQARAKQRADEADSELGQYASLDADIAAFDVQQVKANRTDPLPSSLAKAQQSRGAVIDRLHAAHVTYDTLAGETKAARENLTYRAGIRDHCALHVISAFAANLAIELDRAINRVEELRCQIGAAAATWISTQRGAMSTPLSSPTKVALHREPRPPIHDPSLTERYRDWHRRLLKISNAGLE